MDLTKAILPDSVEVSGRHYRVHTEHSYWFRFYQILEQEKKYLQDFDHLYIDEIPEDRQAGIDAMMDFFYEKKELPRISGDDGGERVLDYEIDSDLIYSAILQCYGIDLYAKQIHWHKVRAMIEGITNTKLNDIMSYRCAKPGRDNEVTRMKQIWALPEKMTEEDKAALERFNAQFE